jgi:hypothetical protein
MAQALHIGTATVERNAKGGERSPCCRKRKANSCRFRIITPRSVTAHTISHSNQSMEIRRQRPAQTHKGDAEPLSTFEVQIIGGFLTLKDESQPRNGAMADIREDDRTEGSPLQMCALECLVQENAITGSSQTIAEFDLLDRARKVFRTAAGPKFWASRSTHTPV